ncbi:MAG: hypothetical protein IT229_07365 [Flavobacteriales bacterium]|nr:hypothetical protein [Flavobacteriales bacterium]
MSLPVRNWKKLLPWMTVYAIAMAFLESAVVVDLRALYYPVEFTFPMAPIDRRIAITELFRELATMVMLLAPGALLTRRALERFAWFIYCFGVWDIFYYVFLKAILNWPATLLDWDILFLVPVPWVGPVLAPVIVSLGMILLGLVILRARDLEADATIRRMEWTMFISAAMIMLYTFVEEPLAHVWDEHRRSFSVNGNGPALDQLRDYIPERFLWALFLVGATIGTVTVLRLWRRWERARVAS